MSTTAATKPINHHFGDLSSDIRLNPNRVIPPIPSNNSSNRLQELQIIPRKPNKFKLTDSLVAPAEKIDVPNHILNTKIYAKLQRNDYFEVAPVEIHFSGFEVGTNETKKYVQILKIINISGQIQRMTVLPPLNNKIFDIHYVKQDRLVPGFALEVKVIFTPSEYKYYNDAIRIFSEGNENLYVPIHAYPILSSYNFPTKYKFPNLAIGKSLTRSFNMRSTAPVEFEYFIEVIQKHPAFTIEPLEGIIPYNRDANINVTFTPKEFCTAIMTIQLIISQFNSKPIVCTFYGTSRPGMAREETYNKVVKSFDEEIENYMIETDLAQQQNDSFPKRVRDSSTKQNRNQEIGDVSPKKDIYVDYQGYRVPANLNAPWAISKVLIQKKGKLSLKDLRSSVKSANKISAQAKEAIFLQRVTELEDEERRNQLKWQVKLGETTIDEETRQEILKSRAKAEYEYKLSIGIPFMEDEIDRQFTVDIDCRTFRPFNKLARTDITFDMFKNQIWQIRYMAMERFTQAARKIIIKGRLLKVLNGLRKFIQSWNDALYDTSDATDDAKLNIENYIEIYTKKLKGQNFDQNEILKCLSSKNIGTYYFPLVKEFKELQNQQARHCEKLSSISKLDSLGPVAVKPIEFQINLPVPYVNLAVPVNYKLNSYKPITENNYVPRHENRVFKLRTGAEDELIQTGSSSLLPLPITPETTTKMEISKKTQTPNNVKQVRDHSLSQAESQRISSTVGIIDLTPSKQLNEPIDFMPMHVFNPAPGIISYQKLLPYSGIELNHHLNPLPRFERDQTFSTQKRFIDKEDVIKGVMTWKKFPSQGLISLSNTPTLTDVWVPRWSNTFGTDILPIETPPLLAGLPADDKENLLDDSDDDSTVGKESKIFLTPEMVNVQFNVPDIFDLREKAIKEEAQFPNSDKLPPTNMPVSIFGQVPRDQREQELEYFLSKQYNTLGIRVQSKLNLIDQQFSLNQSNSSAKEASGNQAGSANNLTSSFLTSNASNTFINQDH